MGVTRIWRQLRALWTGRLGLGTTFWVGVFLVNAVAVVGFVWLEFIAASMQGDAGYGALQTLISGLYLLGFIYSLLLLNGLIFAARKTPEVGGWRWAGVAIGLAFAVVYGAMVFVF